MILSTEGLGHPQVCQRIVQFTKDLLLLDEPKAQRAAAVVSQVGVSVVSVVSPVAPIFVAAIRLFIAAPHRRRSSLPPFLLVAAPRLVVAAPRRCSSSSRLRGRRSSSRSSSHSSSPRSPSASIADGSEGDRRRSGRPAPCRESREEGTAAGPSRSSSEVATRSGLT